MKKLNFFRLKAKLFALFAGFALLLGSCHDYQDDGLAPKASFTQKSSDPYAYDTTAILQFRTAIKDEYSAFSKEVNGINDYMDTAKIINIADKRFGAQSDEFKLFSGYYRHTYQYGTDFPDNSGVSAYVEGEVDKMVQDILSFSSNDIDEFINYYKGKYEDYEFGSIPSIDKNILLRYVVYMEETLGFIKEEWQGGIPVLNPNTGQYETKSDKTKCVVAIISGAVLGGIEGARLGLSAATYFKCTGWGAAAVIGGSVLVGAVAGGAGAWALGPC